MGQWDNGTMGQWGNGAMGQWGNGAMGQWDKYKAVDLVGVNCVRPPRQDNTKWKNSKTNKVGIVANCVGLQRRGQCNKVA